MDLLIRKAKTTDSKNIQELINSYAKEELMLPRSINKLYEDIRDFHVVEYKEELVACGALCVYWEDLAEIKSLAVREDMHNSGIGRQLINTLLTDAKSLGLKRVFALTYQDKFFGKLGFSKVDKSSLPQKIWAECVNCHKFPDCNEICMIINI